MLEPGQAWVDHNVNVLLEVLGYVDRPGGISPPTRMNIPSLPPSLLPVLNTVVIITRKIVNGVMCVAIPSHSTLCYIPASLF